MAEPKATKKEFLEERELITAHSLVNQFGYSYSYACKKLSLFKKQGLVQDMGKSTSYRGQWYLTSKGYRRLYFFQPTAGRETGETSKKTGAVVKLSRSLQTYGGYIRIPAQ